MRTLYINTQTAFNSQQRRCGTGDWVGKPRSGRTRFSIIYCAFTHTDLPNLIRLVWLLGCCCCCCCSYYYCVLTAALYFVYTPKRTAPPDIFGRFVDGSRRASNIRYTFITLDRDWNGSRDGIDSLTTTMMLRVPRLWRMDAGDHNTMTAATVQQQQQQERTGGRFRTIKEAEKEGGRGLTEESSLVVDGPVAVSLFFLGLDWGVMCLLFGKICFQPNRAWNRIRSGIIYILMRMSVDISIGRLTVVTDLCHI